MSNETQSPVESGESVHPLQVVHEKAIETHLHRIQNEFKAGFEFMQKYPKSISVFGSSMVTPLTQNYRDAYELSKKLAGELKYAIVNGGGPGIMEAASRGATEGGGIAVGLRINHIREHSTLGNTKNEISFTYFFTRKAMLAFAAEAFIFFPGGFGTFDELFSILTLIQTRKIPRVPVILYGSAFWNPLNEFIRKNMLANPPLIEESDLGLFEITDSADRVIEIIRRAPISSWWRNIN